MKKISALMLLAAGLGCAAMPAIASETATKKVQSQKKAAAKKPAEADHGPGPDVGNMTAVAYDCELGNKLTIYNNASDDKQIALRWNKRLHQLSRIGTTTGAQRFEDSKTGLVWIGIPAKGMLLDAKKGQQLANECRTAEQVAQRVAEKN